MRKPDSHKAVLTLGDPRSDSVRGGAGTHIPCLRHVSLELEKNKDNKYVLNMFTHWRARNSVHASFNNMFGLSFLMESIASKLTIQMKEEILTGSYIDQSDDFHYNGKDSFFMESFIKQYSRPAEEKYWTTAQLKDAIGDD